MKTLLHKNLASGRWNQLSFLEQLGNIGSEVGRARKWKEKDKETFDGAVNRCLELFDLTLEDHRWKGHLKEIGRAREVFCDSILEGKEHSTSLEDLEKYFLHFAIAARRDF